MLGFVFSYYCIVVSENPLKDGSCLVGLPSKEVPDVPEKLLEGDVSDQESRKKGRRNVGFKAYPRFAPQQDWSLVVKKGRKVMRKIPF